MALVLKVDMGGDLRRCRMDFPEGSGNASKWALLSESVRLTFKLEGDAALTLKYRDEEGDLCTLTEHTLPDFLALSAGGPMRLTASVGAAPAAAAAADAAAADAAGAKPAEGGMDPAKMLEAFDLIKGVIKMAKGKGKGCGRKRQWMQEGCHEDWRECKRRWRQEQAMKHECPLCFTEMSAPWTCDGCSASCGDGSLPRYRCAAGCDFDLCGECFVKKEERDATAEAKKGEAAAAAAGATEENAGDGFPEGDVGAEHQPDPCWEQWKAWKMMMRAMKGKCKGKGKWGKGKGKWGKGKCGAPESEEGAEEEAWPEGPAAFWMQAVGQMCDQFAQAQQQFVQAQQPSGSQFAQAQWQFAQAQQAQQTPAPSAPPAGADKDVEMTQNEPEGK